MSHISSSSRTSHSVPFLTPPPAMSTSSPNLYFRAILAMRLDVTKKELTERLGIHRPSLSRKLGRMRADELVTYDRKGIGIRNLEAIRGLCQR